MFTLKRFSIFIIVAVVAISVAVAQNREMTVEESYLQEAIENMIITELARSSSRDQKLIALEWIGQAIDRGNTSAEIHQTLAYLSIEGTRSVIRENNRIVNNFPEVRRQAARYLGQLGTEEARVALIEIMLSDNEPMVLQEAIKALGDIGTNENNQTVATIAWVFTRFDNLNPDNLMALAAIDAFEKIARNSGSSSPEVIQVLNRIATGHYITPVRERARQLMAEMRTYGR